MILLFSETPSSGFNSEPTSRIREQNDQDNFFAEFLGFSGPFFYLNSDSYVNFTFETFDEMKTVMLTLFNRAGTSELPTTTMFLGSINTPHKQVQYAWHKWNTTFRHTTCVICT